MIYEEKSGSKNLGSDITSQTLRMPFYKINPNEIDHMKIHLKEL